VRLAQIEIGHCPRKSLGKIEKRIGARPEGAQRQPRRRLTPQPRDDARLEQRRFPGARGAEDDEGAAVALGANLAKIFQGLGDLAAAAVEQGGVRVLVAERRQVRSRP
jgi:hypothetical protein